LKGNEQIAIEDRKGHEQRMILEKGATFFIPFSRRKTG